MIGMLVFYGRRTATKYGRWLLANDMAAKCSHHRYDNTAYWKDQGRIAKS